MGWMIALFLALATAGALAIGARSIAAFAAIAGVIVMGLAGYAWQGRPTLPGQRSTQSVAGSGEDSLFAVERGEWIDAAGHDADRLTYLDALERNGMIAEAAEEADRFVAQSPRSMPLALGLANALFLKNQGIVSPPVTLAYQAASRLAPGNPAPAYFLGLALAQSGQFDESALIWRGEIANAPADATWRTRIEERLTAINALRDRLTAEQQQ